MSWDHEQGPMPKEFVESRPDGWPLCPGCGEDELWSAETYPSRLRIAGCYACPWRPGKKK